jgi:hypothetical protein
MLRLSIEVPTQDERLSGVHKVVQYCAKLIITRVRLSDVTIKRRHNDIA